jgi:hypothetical protein
VIARPHSMPTRRRSPSRALGSVLAAAAVAASALVAGPAPAQAASPATAPAGVTVQASAMRSAATKVSTRTLLSQLPVATEHASGYKRSTFQLWVDVDHDRCDTRAEVLLSEAKRKPRRSATCALSGGRWVSAYDGKTFTRASGLDIDHVVPLAEAWRSGASSWTTAKRQSFANDLTRPQLIAVTDNVNQSKGDQDPSTWQPSLSSYRCTYSKMWIAVKHYWALKLQSAEKSALQTMLNTCSS